MDGPSSRLQEDLAGIFRGRIFVDDVMRAAYSPLGASTWPRAVVAPADADDLAALVTYAAETRLPLRARGSGHSLIVPPAEAVIVDLARGFRNIHLQDAACVHVEAGVTVGDLKRFLQPLGLDVRAVEHLNETATVGGWLATSSALRSVQAVEVVLPTGTRARMTNDPLGASSEGGLPLELRAPLLRLLEDRHALLQHRVPRATDRLALGSLRADEGIAWTQLFCGSVGRVGLITAATLTVQPLARHRGSVVFAASDLETTLRVVPLLMRQSLTRCTLLDQRQVALAREHSRPWRELFSPRATAALLLQWEAGDEAASQAILQSLLEIVQTNGPLEVCRIAFSADDVEALRQFPQDLERDRARHPHLRSLPWNLPTWYAPLTHWEHVVGRMLKLLIQHRVTVLFSAEATTGQLSFRPISTDAPVDVAGLTSELRAVIEASFVDSEHSLESLQLTERSYHALCLAVQELFDPQGILDPARNSQAVDVVAMVETGDNSSNAAETANGPSLVPLQLQWTVPQYQAAAARCNGCGDCRTLAPAQRMCPFFRQHPCEESSPRAKATVAWAVSAGRLPADLWSTPEAQPIVSTCFQCQQCRSECPTEVDIPRLMLEARAQRVATLGLSRAQWALTRGPDWMPWLRRLTPLLNPLLKVRWGRGLVERLFGITCQRRLPPIASRSFLQQMPRAWSAPPARLNARTVILFVDHYANWHEPELAFLAGKILEHQGLTVHVPYAQRRSGFDLLVAGDLEAARPLAERNLACLEEFARAGCPIVCLEPSAAVCLREEYPALLNHPDAAVVAAQVDELGHYLGRLHAAGELRTDFAPVETSAAYHQPCHLRSQGKSSSLLDLCNLIPGLSTPRIEAGCSGMAGVFGWDAATVDQSLAMGAPLAAAWQSHPAKIALSECSSCRLQLEHLTQRPARHPLMLLAEAYRLTPARS